MTHRFKLFQTVAVFAEEQRVSFLAFPIIFITILGAVFVTAETALSQTDLAAQGCAAIASRVDALAGNGPVFLRSYDHADGDGPNAEPALNGAFSYDNALAILALIACGRTDRAARIGAAFLQAIDQDRAGAHGRLRNAYRPGAQNERPIPPMGWWSEAEKRWVEDPYQVGTATGNVAWVGLALVALGAATEDPRYREGARKLADWIETHTMSRTGAGGFTGGIFAEGEAATVATWKSTEHAADLAALFARLGRSEEQSHARAFLDEMWRNGKDYFVTGTIPDGATVNRATSGLDAQLWPLLLADAPPDWQAALAYAEHAHGVPGGFDFNDDRDGLWVEGTAQAALVYRVLGRPGDADRLLGEIAKHVSPGGYLWATRETEVTTGLAIGPDSTTDDFRYYRLPHLGATAWAVLAATGWNPFTGQPVN